MKYLGNDHAGFDREALCFPAMGGSHALCYVTDAGLYGFHNCDGVEKNRRVRDINGRFIRKTELWRQRSEVFAGFVRSHIKGISKARRLYGVCFASGENGRAYGGTDPLKTWLDELSAFAAALNFGGQIWGYNLAEQTRMPPLNARFIKTGGACTLQLKTFIKVETLRGPNVSPNDHKLIKKSKIAEPPGYLSQATEGSVVTTISDTGWQTLFPERLR
jgi:hypothetical protein